jgi:queuine/archaeosine tRNA-ribosyltransferase
MYQPKIPNLKSRYVPVHSNAYVISSEVHWWKKTSPFIYPYVLINLLTCSKEGIDKLRENSDEELFLLTDSGGFQVGSGTCNINWEESLLKQIELGASKIFSFDKPVLTRDTDKLNIFKFLPDNEAKKIIDDNFEVALKQSQYLKEKYPNEFKKFCYILQGKSYEQLKYNIEIINKKLGGINNYLNHFPGGIVYGAKGGDNLYIAISARHAYENFIKNGIYVHFLGMGSFIRLLILIRNEISTFDSSTILQATRVNDCMNPIDLKNSFQVSSENYLFTNQFCLCPVCNNVDYIKFINEDKLTMVGRHLIGHNLWHTLSINVLLDALPKDKYTDFVVKNFKINEEVKRCLDFCDDCDKIGFEIAYEKYKPYLKKDDTKQNSLF